MQLHFTLEQTSDPDVIQLRASATGDPSSKPALLFHSDHLASTLLLMMKVMQAEVSQ